jgi:UDP-N-acetylglucosamine 2-epimerase (non-hydrolysing)
MPLLVFTGQHPQLQPADHGLDLYPAIRLACPGQDDPHRHVGDVTKAALPVLYDEAPALVLVQGDTSSALGGALAARLADIPVGHVEAGLRSHDRRRPWPEEEFRVAIDAEAELLFAPTDLSAANLRREGVRGQIHVTGNSGIDSVLAASKGLEPAREGPKRLLVTCHRRENWGEGLAGVAAALRQIAAEKLAQVEVVLHPNPALAASIRAMLMGHAGIVFRPPCSHREAIAAMLGSDLVLSDSGGIQEEAAALGVPLLVLRDRTERPEAIACGNLELVGTDGTRIVSAVRRRLGSASSASPALPYGDGKAGERIAAIIEEWLEDKEALSPRMRAVARTAYSW